MTTNSPIANLPIPELTDPPNGPAAFQALANALDPITIPRFASASARDLKIPSPSDGQHAYLTDSHSLTVYKADLGAWTPYSFGRSPQLDKFTATGTWTKPDGARSVWVRIVGGGGAGGGANGAVAPNVACGGSGGAGGYSESWYDANDLPATVAVTIGNNGSGSTGGTGGSGTATTFGAFMTANGGSGGGPGTATQTTATAAAGVGGTATGGNLVNAQGQNGSVGQIVGGAFTYYQKGAASPFGSGGAAATSSSGNGDAASGFGSGGGNSIANTTSRAGGAGAKGIAIIVTFF